MLKEFKEFAMRGSVVDMAVGIIIGAAFTAIARSLVDDLLMPPLGIMVGGADLSNLFVVLQQGNVAPPYPTLQAARQAGAVTLNYGAFFNSVFHFFIVSLALFVLVRQVNRLKSAEEPPEAKPTTRDCPYCLSTIPFKASRCPHCTSTL